MMNLSSPRKPQSPNEKTGLNAAAPNREIDYQQDWNVI